MWKSNSGHVGVGYLTSQLLYEVEKKNEIEIRNYEYELRFRLIKLMKKCTSNASNGVKE